MLIAGFDNDTMYADNVDFSGGTPVSAKVLQNGELLIGAGATPNIRVNTLTAGSGVTISNGPGTITIGLTGGGIGIDSVAVQTGTSPVVPTIAGLITFNGAVVAAGTNPVRTDGTGANTYALEVQISQAIAATDATKIGLCNFDSASFDVDANGFVQLNGGGIATTSFDVQSNTGPGTDPVVPTAAGVVTVNGAAVANHSVVLETRSRAANAYNLEIQYSAAAAATDATKSGVAHFNSTQFSVDANGFVELAGAGIAIDSIGTQTGTNPITPTAAGLVTINGAVVAAGTNPLRSNGTGANTMALEVQISQALAATDATKIGLCNFDSADFGVDANGFVTLAGGGAGQTITGDSGGALSPSSGNWNILGGPGVTTTGSGSTLTINSVVFTDQGGSTSVLSDSGSFATAAITLTLPATPAQGELCEFTATTAAVLVIDAPSTHLIRAGNAISSAGGTLTSSGLAGDAVILRYRASTTTWHALSLVGVWITA